MQPSAKFLEVLEENNIFDLRDVGDALVTVLSRKRPCFNTLHLFLESLLNANIPITMIMREARALLDALCTAGLQLLVEELRYNRRIFYTLEWCCRQEFLLAIIDFVVRDALQRLHIPPETAPRDLAVNLSLTKNTTGQIVSQTEVVRTFLPKGSTERQEHHYPLVRNEWMGFTHTILR